MKKRSRVYKAPKITTKKIKFDLFYSQSSIFTDSLDPFTQNKISGDLYALNCCDVSKATCSDKRLKKNIRQLSNVLPKLSSIRGIRFLWKNNKKFQTAGVQRKQIGFIAQEMEREFPEIVHRLGNTGIRTIEYDKVTVILLEAVNQLNTQLKTIKKKLE